MPSSELILRGFELLVLGSGTLAVFVVCLFFLVKLISRSIEQQAWYHPPLAPIVRPVVSSARERQRIAAIAAAIHRHHARFG